MFGRYNINELYLANIAVLYPEPDINNWDTNIGGIFMMSEAGYGYWTIVRKVGEKYYDLNNLSRHLCTTRDPKKLCHIIEYIEPLSNYYTQDGKRKKTFSRRQALKTAEQYYNEIHKNWFNQTDEERRLSLEK